MIATFMIWVYILALVSLYGFLIIQLLTRFLNIEDEELPSFSLLWVTGLCTLTTVVSFLSLFIKIDLAAHLIVVAGGVLILVWAMKHKRSRFSLWSNTKAFHPILRVLLIIAVLNVLENATHLSTNVDTGIYHAQAIRWIESYPVVKGLGNLHGRLAYNSSWLVINTLFSFSFLSIQSFHLLGSVFFLVSLWYFTGGISNLLGRKPNPSDLIKTLLFPISFFVLASEISSPGTDLPAILLTWIVICEWMSIIESSDEASPLRLSLLVIFSIYSITIKLSSAPLLLVGIYCMKRLFTWRGYGVALRIAGILLLVLSPWVIRNVVLSGYLLYPEPSVDLFRFDWKIPPEIVASEKNTVQSWAKIPGRQIESVVSMPVWEWVPPWFSRLSRNRQIIMVINALVPFVFCMFALFTFKYAKELKQELKPFIYVYLVSYCGFLFWFFTAPDFRFGYGFIIVVLLLAILPIAVIINKWMISRSRIAPVIVAVLIIAYQGSVLVRSFEPGTFTQRMIMPADYQSLPTVPCKLRNVTLWCAQEYNECWYEPFPCVPSVDPKVEMRGKDFAEGFRNVDLKQ